MTYTDAVDGSPLVDMRLSQGGPPCIDFMSDLNSLRWDEDGINKADLYLHPYSYEDGCKRWTINGQAFAESTQHKHVPGWQGTNELAILDQNDGSLKWSMSRFRHVNFEAYQHYTYEMYSRHYMDWECAGKREDFLHEATYMNEGLGRMHTMNTLCYIQVGIVTIEVILWFLCREHHVHLKIFAVTRLIACALCVWMFWLLFLNIMSEDSPENLPVIQEVTST